MFPLHALLLLLAAPAPTTGEIDLAGEWRFALDPEDRGVAESWWFRELPERIQLPGILQAQGFGEEVTVATEWTAGVNDRSWFEDEALAPYREPGAVKIPFWLQPDRHYVGAAWYQREVVIPEEWVGKRVTLELERCHWTTRLWLGAREIAERTSLSTPHLYELPSPLAAGTHVLTLRIDNRLHVDVGINAHSVSDHTQSNWNGVVGELRLRATDGPWLEEVQVFPQPGIDGMRLQVTIGQEHPRETRGTLAVHVTGPVAGEGREILSTSHPFELDEAEATIEVDCAFDAPPLPWDEFQPALYDVDVELRSQPDSPTATDARRLRIGFREVATDGTQITVNGRPIFLRGTLECCIFPLTGHPPMDAGEWRRILRVCQAHGLNHLRFHSWCPPEAAFVAADELGVYLQVEAAAWASVGDGQPQDEWIRREAREILRRYGNHPSLLMLAYGNEPGGGKQREYLAGLVEEWRAGDARHLYTSGAGWPLIPESDFHSTPEPRIQHWGAGLSSRVNARPPETASDFRDFVARHDKPVVSHEIGQWCVYPDFDQIPKHTGYLKAKSFELFRDTLNANHMGDLARDFLLASGRLQLACYKEEIESALRTPGMGGFQLLDLHDFPGQGTALVGVLDPFWDSKPYCTPAEYHRFCGPTVPLARLEKRVFTSGETLHAALEVAHYGPADLEDAELRWRLETREGHVRATGTLPPRTLTTGELTPCGEIVVPLDGIPGPAALRLVASIDGTEIANDWNLWVYPEALPAEPSDDLLVTPDLEVALEALAAGGRVLWTPPPHRVRTDVALAFSSIFWNTSWTRGQPPHTLGILCSPSHPVLRGFPTDYHSDWQWWYAISNAAPFPLDGFPPELRPLVQVVPDWFTNERLALLFEARVGAGRLLVSSIDVEQGLDDDPVRRQLRSSLLAYATSEDFAPEVETPADLLRSRVRSPSALERLGATITADNAHADFPAALAIDGDPTTFWHTPWGEERTDHPHHLTLDLGRPVKLSGLEYLPRQDMANGRIAEFEVCVGNDPSDLAAAAVTGRWGDETGRQRVLFDRPLTARFLRLVANSEVNGNFFAAVAELDLITD